MSTSLRLREWEKDIGDVNRLLELGGHLEVVRTPLNVARALGLLQHPLLRALPKPSLKLVVPMQTQRPSTGTTEPLQSSKCVSGKR